MSGPSHDGARTLREAAGVGPPVPDVRFGRALLALGVLGLSAQAALLIRAFGVNPYARVPVLDGRHFWEWGGRIAAGEWVQDAPFFSAPLFPYLVGLVRLFGGGLEVLAAVQAVLLVGAALLTAVATRRVLGAASGAVAGALVLVTSDAALSTSRVLGGPLQLLLVALVLERATALSSERPRRSAVALGLAAGAATLAWPALLAALPLFALWAGVVLGRGAGLAALGAALLAVLPATLHNAVAAGEFIPVSAHAGVTFWHGNNPGATGTFSAGGVQNSKDEYHLDALAQAREALGADAGWADASAYFRDRGLAWWASDPAHAARVALRKLWYALSGRVYGDIYQPALERRDGLLPGAWLAPVPLAAFTPLGLAVAILLLLRRPVRTLPLVVLAGLPLAICVAFWFTPRYRLPALPGLCLCVALALQWVVAAPEASAARRRSARTLLLAAAAILGLGSGALNRAVGFDAPAVLDRLHHERTAVVLGQEGDHARAAVFMRRALLDAPDDADLRRRNFDLLRWLGREAEAISVLRAAPPAVADDVGYRAFLAWTLATSPSRDARDGAEALRLALALVAEDEGRDPVTLDALGAAYAELGRYPAAIEAVDRARAWVPGADPYNAELLERRECYKGLRPWRDSPATAGAAGAPDR